MADKENPRTTADHFEFDEEKALPVSKFFKTYKNRLPMLAIIIEGIYGLTRYDSYDCFQVIRVHCYTAQPRVVCMKEDDAIKKSYRYITIPVRTGLLYRVVKSRRNQSQPMTMEEILNKYALPSLVEMEPQEKQVKVKVGNSIRNLGRFLLLSKYEENYLKQNCIVGDDLEMNSTACMLNMNDENTVTPITGFKNRSKEEFERYLKKLAKQAAEDPEQYNRKDGNPDSTEHILSETTYGSASIPTTMRPEEALRMIRSFQSEPLPALPPLPPGEIPSSPALPPRRPLPSPSSQSTGSAPLKQMIVKDGGEDDDDSSDYEVPLENPQECPKLPPRGSFKKQSSASVKEPRDRDKLMAELVLKMNRDTKPNDKPGESCPKLPKRPVMKLPDPTGVPKKEERRKDGYENTKIGRAVVRPQQIVTMDNEYEVADILSVPEVEPDICIRFRGGSHRVLATDKYKMFSFLINIFGTLILAILISIYFRKGKDHLLKIIVLALKELPGVNTVISLVLKNEVTSFVKSTSLAEDVNKTRPRVVIPEKGLTVDELRKQMEVMKKRESNTEEDGNVFAYTYTLLDDHFKLQQETFDRFSEKTNHSVEQDALVKEFFHGFMHENALNPMIYPALRLMETEIVSMTAAMLNGSSSCVGFLTSGGTESNLMAVKAYRDRAAKLYPNIQKPNIVAPITVHPTIDKGGHYFGLEVKHTRVTDDFKADVKAMEKAIDSNTVMLVASAPQFCHGIVDPIEDIAALAKRRGIPLHVDCCFGGFMLPWVEKLGYPVPKFDFRCVGVTSISADVHKYGYSVKGASVILYVNDEYRRHQIYAYSEWPGGLYGSPSMAGTRPGGNIGAAWAAMKALGEEGYKTKAKALMNVTKTMIDKIRNIDGLRILGEPSMTAFAIGSSDSSINIQAVADDMEKRGWKMERNQNPDSLHCSILPHHIPVHQKFLDDLEKATNFCRNNKSLNNKGTAGVYGMMASIPDKGIVTDFLVEFFSEVYKCK